MPHLTHARNIGYHIHPALLQRLPPKPTIADIGTGTGLFAIQTARQLPAATLVGLDISDKCFHPASALPGNVTLGTYDIHQPPPPALQDKFDLVHVQIIVAGMQPEDWAPAVQHLLAMLRPGGAIQWVECDYPAARFCRGTPGSSTAAADRFGFAWRDALLAKFSHGFNTLPGIMRDAGMQDVASDMVASDRVAETRRRLTVNSFVIAGIGNRAMAERKVPGAMTVEEIEKAEKAAFEALDTGVYVRYDVWINMGIKP